MSSMNKVAKELKNILSDTDSKKPKAYDTEATVVRTDGDKLWVKFPGGETETPVRKTIDAKPGDVVMVRVANHRAWTSGNYTNPPTDDTRALRAENTANDAAQAAQKAWEQAESAEEAAGVAWGWADSAHEAANVAWGHADDAYNAAYNAGIAAGAADTAAQQALIDAGTAKTMADSAIQDAGDAKIAAQDARNAAIDAEADASTARDAAITAESYANQASTFAKAAAEEAQTAKENSDNAILAARTANVAASGAVASLSTVQDVIGTLNWIAEHAQMDPTQDPFVIPGKMYFIKSGDTYSPVDPEDGANPSALGYYEITNIRDSVSNYVSTHVALAGDNGIYIQTGQGEATSRMLVSPKEGVVIYGQNGEAVAKYGANTIIGNEEDVHLEINNSEVDFYDGPSHSRITNPTGNPQANRYYEKNERGEYILSEDTSVVASKTYYSRNMPVAYINNQRLYITQSVVTDNMMVGENKWIWKFDSRDDSIILKWIGT